MAFWIAAVSRVVPSPVAPKSRTFTSFACTAAANNRMKKTGNRLLRFGDFEDRTVELLAAGDGDAVAHQGRAFDRVGLGRRRLGGDVELADRVAPLRVE